MLPDIEDILKLKKKHKLSSRKLAKELNDEPTFGWINKVENGKIKDPSYLKMKKIYEYFERLEKINGDTIEGKYKKIKSFKIGDDVKTVSTIMAKHGFSQVPIYDKNKICVGMLTDKIITKLANLRAENKKIKQSNLDPINPKIQHNDILKSVEDIFDLYDYVLVEKNGKIVGILTRQDLNQELLK
jgi:predicted transcriptional regulator